MYLTMTSKMFIKAEVYLLNKTKKKNELKYTINRKCKIKTKKWKNYISKKNKETKKH